MSFSLVTTNWFRLTFPVLLLAMIGLGMNNVILLTQANLGITANLPYFLFLSVIGLGHAFKQCRIAMVALTMLVVYWYIQEHLQSSLSTGSTLLELSLLAFVVPIACALVYPYKERGVLSRSFIIYIVTLSLMGLWCYLILTHFYEGGFKSFDKTFLYSEPSVSRLPLILVLYSIGAVLLSAIFVLKANRIIDAVVYSAITLSTVTFTFFHIQYVSSTMFTLSGFLLLIYMFSASYELAFKDRLTDIPGRLALESDLRHLGKRYTIAMLDIDHFKSFNDTYGHETGDDVLKLVASKMKQVGGRAKVYRYGGEEFTVLFKNKNVEEALDHLELLRASIEEYEMVVRNEKSRPKNDKTGAKKRKRSSSHDHVNVTISIGVADYSDADNVGEVMKSADAALYKAKRAGRNRVEIA
ncbi:MULTISPECIES: GGDEF domain-containing protein [Vibrio]|uniref:GGDEF domain-containing protein n=1 Tax=Vibrio TaxID=662 RepID=UPI002075EE48|nr:MULTISPECIES: GGDEF domain-containing protein [Vibrio]USD35344.1 GGDEF domain-containing protein [Vibrio sp. SCSIO 43186]USD48410.1 GGDEF domain-containing protein [Vibrio sp. SCSIO 43145]USD72469.1 GGDEF domain-containing protein [Vibrio sp. SCSIO 43139]USD98145.1 GGDEF domain-containing protein [Vibrio coralliilyticus]